MRVRPPQLALPYMLGLGLLVGLPAAAAVVLSFTEFSGVRPPRFTGLENFRRMASDDVFWHSLGNSAIYVLIAVPLRIGAAVGMALLLHRDGRAATAGRTSAFLPSVMPDAAIALLWLWVLNPLYGPIAQAAAALGLVPPQFLVDPWATRIALPVLGAFQLGEAFIVVLAVRSAIPQRFYDVADVSGAGKWFQTTRITFPLLAPALALLAIRDLILSFQMNFVPALMITGGGPRNATLYLSLYTYQSGFRYFRLGYASALSVTMLAITAALVAVQLLLAKRWMA